MDVAGVRQPEILIAVWKGTEFLTRDGTQFGWHHVDGENDCLKRVYAKDRAHRLIPNPNNLEGTDPRPAGLFGIGNGHSKEHRHITHVTGSVRKRSVLDANVGPSA
jgi:hypothetical protein